MKICVLSPADLSQDVGASIVVRSLMREWRKSHSVSLMTDMASTFQMDGVEKIEVRGGTYRAWLLSSAAKIPQILSHEIILDEAYTFPLLVTGRLERSTTTFMHSHGVARPPPGGGPLHFSEFREYVERLLSIRSATSTIAASRLHKEAILGTFGQNLGPRVHVIPHGVDAQEFRESGPKGKSILFVGNVGRGDLFMRKGVPILLEALSMLRHESPDIGLVSVGDTDQRFSAACQKFGVTDVVQQLGRLGRSELARVYSRCRVLVVPSLFDTYGQVVNEAMSVGIPVIVSDRAGASEIVKKANCGLIFRAGNAGELRDCLSSIIANDELAAQFGRNGSSYARSNLSWEAIGKQYIELFKSALK